MVIKSEIEQTRDSSYPVAPKLSSGQLRELDIKSDENRKRVMDLAIAGVKEIAPDLSWDFVLTQVDLRYRKPRTGEAAAAYIIGYRIISSARKMEWNLDDPEPIYMMGFFIEDQLSKKLKDFRDGLSNAPNRNFLSEDTRKQKLAQEEELFGKLKEFIEPFSKVFTEFTQRYLPNNQKYLAILQKLPTVSHGRRAPILNYLQKGRIEDAYDAAFPE